MSSVLSSRCAALVGAAAVLLAATAGAGATPAAAAGATATRITTAPTSLTAGGVVYRSDRYFEGGRTARWSAPIARTTQDHLYRYERYGMDAYRVPVANGSYRVTLLESENHFTGPGMRVFSVAAEGRTVAKDVDVFAAVGRDAAYDLVFDVRVSDGVLDLTFQHHRDVAKVDALRIVPVPASAPVPAAFGPASGRPFAATSAWNTPIGASPSVDPGSAAMVANLAGSGYATAQAYDDTPPIYDADAGTPRYDLVCTQPWGPCPLGSQVPLPAGATASPGYDANMLVVDWSSRRVYEFWQYRNDRRTVSWGAVNSIDGDGRTGAVGAGVSRLAGLIRPHEIRAGVIDHALVGPTGNSCTTHRYPATKSDGWSTAAGCIPEGARVQLDPAVDCQALPAPAWEKIVCRALQTHGWYNIDNGGTRGAPGFGIQFENPAGEPDPYPAAGLAWDYMHTTALPLHRLRVLAAWNS